MTAGIYSIILAIFLKVLFGEEVTFIECAGLAIPIVYLGLFIGRFGKEMVIVQAIGLIACIQYLFAPAIAYAIYDKHLVNTFMVDLVMPINSGEYFAFALPAVIALLLGLHSPVVRNMGSDRQFVTMITKELSNKEGVGILLMFIGITGTLVYPMVPMTLKGTVHLISQLMYIGALYIFFSKLRYKQAALIIALSVLVIQSIMRGMYGELIYWCFLGTSILMLKGRAIGMTSRIGLAVLGIVIILLLQSIKHEYRDEMWGVGRRDYDVSLFMSLITERLKNPESIVEPERLYNMTVRSNQGYLLARAMNYVPKFEPLAEGETILTALSASFVPRLLWPGKPQAGGFEKRCRFLGDCRTRDYSYNIGHLGEAYVNFGKVGGILFMFLYGVGISVLLSLMKRLAGKRSTLFLWLPLFFFAALSLETDFLTTLNTLVKSLILYLALFVFFILAIKVRL